ncbi:MAG: DUF4331 domain-containing protein, partial [Gammaproteobacteria bacterium]|nr:DUF4331 domain-containing protein [Gammaproteobacteria bacterium]
MQSRLIFAITALTIISCSAVFAADHRDGPLAISDPAADLNDVYAFVNPNDPDEVILAATFMPFAGSHATFSDAVDYHFNLQGMTSGEKPLTIKCSFKNGDEIKCKGKKIKVKGDINEIATGKGTRVFAGLRDDPFYFDGAAFGATVATLTPQFSDPGTDTFEGANVLAIVLGIESDRLSKHGDETVFKFYASTHRKDGGDDDDDDDDDDGNDECESDDDDDDRSYYRGSDRQIDRTGRPAINTALIDLLASTGLKDQYNQAEDIDSWAPLFEMEIANNLAALDTLDGVVGNNLLPPMVLASVLVDDRLIIDVSIPECDAYLAVELGVPQCGGRTLERDVIDDTFGAVVGPGVSDFVPNTNNFLDEFPFMGE